MAGGDPVVQILQVLPPNDDDGATPDTITGASTIAEMMNVWDFDAATDEYLDFLCRLHGYQGNGLTFRFQWSASTATSGSVMFGLAIRRLADDAEDFDTTSHSYTYNETATSPPSAVGELQYGTITFNDGSDMDSWADGELAVVRARRNADDASDTMSGDFELWALIGEETA